MNTQLQTQKEQNMESTEWQKTAVYQRLPFQQSYVIQDCYYITSTDVKESQSALSNNRSPGAL